jgi:hypothetical protein
LVALNSVFDLSGSKFVLDVGTETAIQMSFYRLDLAIVAIRHSQDRYIRILNFINPIEAITIIFHLPNSLN